MHAAVLTGYFGKHDDAHKAFKRLRVKGFLRAAWVTKTLDGVVRIRDPFQWRRASRSFLSFLLFGALSWGLSISLDWHVLLLWNVVPAIALACGLSGGSLVFAALGRRVIGVRRDLVESHARWLVGGESVVILQSPIESLTVPVAVLLETGDVPPAVFINYPMRESPEGEEWTPAVPSGLSQIGDDARGLAAGHTLASHWRAHNGFLKSVDGRRRWIHDASIDVNVANQLEQTGSPAAEWLLDNQYIFEGNARKVLRNLPRRFYRQLPPLLDDQDKHTPRIYALAKHLGVLSDLRVDQENIITYIEAYQTVKPLSIGEIWAVPQMIRIVLMEGIQQIVRRVQLDLRERSAANFWANRIIAVNRRDPHRIFAILSELNLTHPNPSPYFAIQLIDYLYDEESALTPVQSWLERKFQKSLADLNQKEKYRQTRDQISIGNAFTSLRTLDQLDWKICFERLSLVEALLRQDPSGIYPHMDFETRDRCRRSVENLHRGSGIPEETVAQRIIDLATRNAREHAGDASAGHVATYLFGPKRDEVARMIGCRESVRYRAIHWTYRHHTVLYFAGLIFFTSLFLLLPMVTGFQNESSGVWVLLGFLLLIPASQLAMDVVNYLVIRLLPPQTLPKMDYRKSGIPDSCRTLVIVPMMLANRDSMRDEAEKLEIRYLANKEHNLLFGLFTDFLDAPQAHCDTDGPLLDEAIRAVDRLNQRYGGNRFLLFHRERTWNESEQKFIGWERKRGKLEELNGLLAGTRADDAPSLLQVGSPNQLSEIRYVITLDSDTQLPNGTARRLIETASHPLNQIRFDAAGRIVSGYTIIQPRVSSTLPSMNGSLFSRLFSDPVGIDPYTNAVSDVNQDLAGEGSYHGKGIYDIRAFNRILAGKFPESWLLSHDLIEGAHVRVALASDIELYDEFPQRYDTFAKRRHRWIRGDWQIAGWTLPRVPRSDGGKTRNPLSWFDRGKIFDNLRRSVLPAATVALLVASWLLSSPIGVIASVLVAVQLLFHSLAQPFTWATTTLGSQGVSLRKLPHDLLRVGVEASLLPFEAWSALDAISRALYRRHISHRDLLEWNSSQSFRGKIRTNMSAFVFSLSVVSLFSLAVGWLLIVGESSNLPIAGPWLFLWFAAPVVGWVLNRRPEIRLPRSKLAKKDIVFLRNIACRTWRFFSTFVNEESSWLPPDNYQVAYQNLVAMRTSPTNIGLWMVSAIAAHEFGYITADDVTRKLSGTLKTLRKLDRHEGHLLNWYDIQTLAPLKPRYVSTVDSGNLLGALWSVDQGLSTLLDGSIVDQRSCDGLRDTVQALVQALVAGKVGGKSSGVDPRVVRRDFSLWSASPQRAIDILQGFRASRETVRGLVERISDQSKYSGDVRYWGRQLQVLLDAWLEAANRYLSWMEILNERTVGDIAALGTDAAPAFIEVLRHAPSLRVIAEGKIAIIEILRSASGNETLHKPEVAEWADRVLTAFGVSQWLAGEMLGLTKKVAQESRDFSQSMNMRFLYDSERRMFSIGYNITEGRLDRAFYDLLASEARLGSFVAIARGDVPAEHWFAMSRPYGSVGRRRVLLSWTGTMFEYLMPLIFQRSYANSLLEKATREAVDVQIAYGRAQHMPWGISESASGDLDNNKTYQYNAFGVPALGLKRGQSEKVVIAPYATLLALTISPREGVRNLRRLVEWGLLDEYGFFDSIDLSQQASLKGERGVVVRTYMSHHQGMGFLALTNLLRDDAIQNTFHADQRIRTVEPLLHERIPYDVPLNQVSDRVRVTSVAAVGEVAPSVSQFETPHTSLPKTQLLSNGRYGVMVTNSGGGFSRWGAFEITRWREDTTRDSWGTFCFFHEAGSNKLWSNTYHPTGGKAEAYSADFSLDRAVFRRTENAIESETGIIVAPEDDVEIRRMTLINRSIRARTVDLTSYIELSMAPHAADRQHPAFNKLFIQTEAVADHRAIIAFRRRRDTADPPVCIGHRFTLESDESADLRFETDRARFIGRGRTLALPMGAFQEPGNSEGFVLDPILSLRTTIKLGVGQRVQVSMVIAAAATREQVLLLMSKYGDPRAIDRAMDFAWASAQLELRLLRIQPDDARRFQQLASHLLYANPLMRSPAERIEENRKGQSGLWAYGISGDYPIALVAIGERQDIGLVRQMLHAHAYWRLHGLVTDLVVLNEEESGYERPLHEQLDRLIQTHAGPAGVDRPGGIFLRSADRIPIEDLTLLRAVSRVVMVAARGNIPQQLGASAESSDPAGIFVPRRETRDPSTTLPFMELPYFNSIGGFTPDGREYAMYLGRGMSTPLPWVNVIANPSFGAVVSETGSGFTWQGNSQRNRLTEWSNDPVTDPPHEALYIRDEDTGVYWTPSASPIREDTAYRARHGAGYTIFEHNSHGINQELTVFLPGEDPGGDAVKLQRLILTNDTSRSRMLSVTYYTEWTLGEFPESTRMHVVTSWDDEGEAVIARNAYHPEFGDRLAFAAMTGPVDSYSGDRTTFLGRNRSMANPSAMERKNLSLRVGAGLDPCAALQTIVRLAPGERSELTCMLGQVASAEALHDILVRFKKKGSVGSALEKSTAVWDERLGTIAIHTPELAADFLVNRWLLYQTLACRLWGRSALYQSGGAFGFRDQLQDVMALVYAEPNLARQHILLAASRQFPEGDVQHWWHEPGGGGIRSRISDDLLWLPYVVANYVRVTGDDAVLSEMVGFLDGSKLEIGQSESYQVPGISTERTSLFDHCQRALVRGHTIGPHGLPLIGSGDWNDGMNRVGVEGKGESVWLGWFLADVFECMAELADRTGKFALSTDYRNSRRDLSHSIETFAWDGEWYLRATFDDESLIGSASNLEARIDSLPQSWAWLSGAADTERSTIALDSAWKHLVHEREGIVLLFEPPFDRAVPSPGYVMAYPPGVRENGGQYTHAAVWMAMAMARKGDGTRAAAILRMLNPIEHARDPEAVWRYGIEPYVAAADVYNMHSRVGRGGWSWYTGSAAWMYRAWIEDILGLRIRGNSLSFSPVIPSWWDGFTLSYRHGEARYEVKVENPDHCEQGVSWAELDGERMKDGIIQMERSLVKHQVIVRMGKPLTFQERYDTL